MGAVKEEFLNNVEYTEEIEYPSDEQLEEHYQFYLQEKVIHDKSN